MSTVPFDTLALARKLEQAGFAPKQAQDTAAALAEAFDQVVATKNDIAMLEKNIEFKLADMKADLFKWGIAALLGQAALVATMIKLL